MMPEPSLVELAEALRERRITSEAAVAGCLERIAQRDGAVGAFIAVDADAALATARQRDAACRAGRAQGPLHGAPIAIKDIFLRRGRPTTAGSRLLADRIGTHDADVVARLDAAGAVLVGTLGLDEFAAGGTGDNAHYGRCRNPWDPERITGGSSSGTAAAVAAGMVPAAIGSDTGGSLRLPAAFCGVTALKATLGSVSNAGVVARARALDTVGPAARSVADCRLLQAAIADRGLPGAAFPAADAGMRIDVATLTLGHALAPFAAGADPRVLACVESVAATLAEFGVRQREVELPDLLLLTRLHQVLVRTDAALLHGQALADCPDRISLAARSAIVPGLFIPPRRQQDALAVRPALLAHFLARAFATVDAVLLPVVGTVAPRYEDCGSDTAAGIARFFGESARACRFVNYLGLPALSLPCGFVDGMPVGAQLIARPWREDVLFALGTAYQQATRWHDARPDGGPQKA